MRAKIAWLRFVSDIVASFVFLIPLAAGGGGEGPY